MGKIHKKIVSIKYPLNPGDVKNVSNSLYSKRLRFHLISSKYVNVLEMTELINMYLLRMLLSKKYLK